MKTNCRTAVLPFHFHFSLVYSVHESKMALVGRPAIEMEYSRVCIRVRATDIWVDGLGGVKVRAEKHNTRSMSGELG